MIEQKFTRAQGASFVNPYHGDSEQLYTPVDTSSLGDSLLKIGAATMKSLSDNAFRQGQIDQLANAVDNDKFFMRNSYMKGATYAKAQNDLMVGAGKIQDIVNKSVSSNKSAEDMLIDIRASQQSVFDAAEELRGDNPEAADAIIRSLQNQQGLALKSYQEQLVSITNRNVDTANSLGNMEVIQEFIQSGDTATFTQNLFTRASIMEKDAIRLGLDPKTYIDNHLKTALIAPLTNVRMDDPNALHLANSVPGVIDTLYASGVIGADTTAQVKGFAEQKLSQAREFASANIMYMVESPNYGTSEKEQTEFMSALERYQLAGGSPKEATGYLVAYQKKCIEGRKGQLDFQLGKAAPISSGEKPMSAWRKSKNAFCDAATAKVVQGSDGTATQQIDPIASTALNVSTSFALADNVDGKKHLSTLETQALAQLNGTGDNFDPMFMQTMDYLYDLLTSDNARIHQGVVSSMNPKLKAFLVSNYSGFKRSLMSSKSNEDVKKVFQGMHEHFARLSASNSTVNPEQGLASMMSNSTLFTAFGLGFGRTGLNEDTKEGIKNTLGVRGFRNVLDNLAAKGITAPQDADMWSLAEGNGDIYKANGYTVIAVGGRDAIMPSNRGNGTYDAQALDNVLAEIASDRYVADGLKSDKSYSRGETAIVMTDDGQLIKVIGKGDYATTEIISRRDLATKVDLEAQRLEEEALKKKASGVIGAVPTHYDGSFIYEKGSDYGTTAEKQAGALTRDTSQDKNLEYLEQFTLDLDNMDAVTAVRDPRYMSWVTKRQHQALVTPGGDWIASYSDRDKKLVETLQESPEMVDVHELMDFYNRDRAAYNRYKAIMLNPVNSKAIDTITVSDGRKDHNTFTITSAIGDTCFGSELGVRIAKRILSNEGFVLNWTKTNPKVTDKPIIGAGYLKGGYKAWEPVFEDAVGDPMKLSIATCKYMVFYFDNIPEKFKNATGIRMDTAITDPLLSETLVSLADFNWHQGKYDNSFYKALKICASNGADESINYLKTTSAYQQSGKYRREGLVNGLRTYRQYLDQNKV